MGLEFLGNVANAYGGFQKGQEQELARQQLAKDREYQQGQREYQGGQQQRTLREQGLADQLRAADMEVSDETEVPAPGLGVQLGGANAGVDPAPMAPPGVGAADSPKGLAASLPPVKVRRTGAEMATEYGKNRRKLGLTAEAMEMDAKAQSFGLADMEGKRKQVKFTQEQAEMARKLQEEGVFDGVRAFRMGDADGMEKALNAGGKYKIEGLTLTREDREVPGVGTVPAYSAKFRKIAPDGTVTAETRNSYDLAMQIMPLEKALELQRKGSDSESNSEIKKAMLDLKGKQVELQGEIGLARVAAASAKSSGQPSREERLRYTSLFQDAGRRMNESQKALSALQKNMLFSIAAAKPGTPEAQQMQELRESIKAHSEERSLYQGLLAGSQPDAKPSASAKPAGLASARQAASAAKPNYSTLWK